MNLKDITGKQVPTLRKCPECSKFVLNSSFQNHMAQHEVVEANVSYINTMDVLEVSITPPSPPQDCEDDSIAEIDDKNWSDEATFAVIESYRNHASQMNPGGKQKKIFEDMAKDVPGKSWKELMRKWRDLVRTYRRTVDYNNKQNGRVRMTWKFYNLMSEILDNEPEIASFSLAGSQNGFFDPSASTSPQSPESDPFEHVWTDEATFRLIDAYRSQTQRLYAKGVKQKDVWEEMARDMPGKTGEDLSRKWRNLLRTYRRIVDNYKKNGRGRMTWKFYTAMDDAIALSASESAETKSSKKRRCSETIIDSNEEARRDLMDSIKRHLEEDRKLKREELKLRREELDAQRAFLNILSQVCLDKVNK